MTTPTPPPAPIRCDRPDCRCAAGEVVTLDRLASAVHRHATALERVLAEIRQRYDVESPKEDKAA